MSCKQEEIQSFNDLTAGERRAIMNRSRIKCLSSTNSHFSSWKSTSAGFFYNAGNAEIKVNKTFKYELKTGTTVNATHWVTVWKKDDAADTVYLLIEIDEPSLHQFQFVKITKAVNDAMIDELQTRGCDLTSTTFRLNPDSQTYRMELETTSKEFVHTHTYKKDWLAFLSRYTETRTSQNLDDDGNPTGTVTTLTGTLANPVDIANIPEFDTYAEYAASGTSTTLCLVDQTANPDTIPFETICDPDGSDTFLPAELAN